MFTLSMKSVMIKRWFNAIARGSQRREVCGWLLFSVAIHGMVFALAPTMVREEISVTIESGNTPLLAAFITEPRSSAAPPEATPPPELNEPVVTAVAEETAELVPEPEVAPHVTEVAELTPPEFDLSLPLPEETAEVEPIETAEVVAPREPEDPSSEPLEEIAFPESAPVDEAIGSDIPAPPQPLVQPAPPYPVIALRRQLEGRVKLAVTLDDLGKPRYVEVAESSGYAFFDRAALETVRDRWRFDRGAREPVIVSMTFELRNR